MSRHYRATLVGLLVLMVTLGLPNELSADVRGRSKPGLSLEAICVTRLNDESVRWLSAVEIAGVVRMLRQATPHVPTKDIPWEYCIALTTEQGNVNCYYNAAVNIICFPPYTNIMQLPDSTAGIIQALFDQQPSMQGIAVPFRPTTITPECQYRLTVAGQGLHVTGSPEDAASTTIALRAPYPDQAGVEIVGVTRRVEGRAYHIYVRHAPGLPVRAAVKINLPVEAGFVYKVMKLR